VRDRHDGAGRVNPHQAAEAPFQLHQNLDVSDLHPTYQKAYKKSKNVDSNRIDMAEFTDHVDLVKDLRAVRSKLVEMSVRDSTQTKESLETMALGEILEAELFDSIHNGLLGSEVKPFLPSMFDDLFLGNDLVLEHSRDGFKSYSSIGVDVTVSEGGFLSKLEKVREKILRGQLNKVKYFASPDGNFRGTLDNVPNFIVGLDRANLFQFTDAWVKGSDVHDEHIRAILLGQIKTQCEYFIDLISRKLSQISDEYHKSKLEKVLSVYTAELKKINGLMERLKVTPAYDDELSKLMLSYKQNRNRYGDQLSV
jgi:hypothetical protein